MISGIGCDIVKINRIQQILERMGTRFKNRIFTTTEIAKAPSNYVMEARYYAKRFAAKEALAKAMGLGIGDIAFKDIEITNNELGAPKISCKKIMNQSLHLSISDEEEFAIAYVVIEKI